MKIALFQSDIDWCNKKENYVVAKKKISEASALGCEVIFFPEMSFTGFTMNINVSKEKNNETIEYIKPLAKENNIAVGFGYVKDLGSKCENHYAVVDSSGEVISDYAKIHPFSAGYESEYFVGGSEITKYKINGMNFSTFICYDLRFPEIFQAVRKDSDIIVVPANWPRSRSVHWKTLLKARAIETECYVLGINCVGVHDDTYYSGDTMAINPFCEVIKCVSNIQDLLVVNINNDVAEYREKLNTNKDRRPDLYKKFLY